LSLAGAALLLVASLQQTAMMVLLSGLVGLMLVGGAAGGSTVFRTLYYLPHFTQGVAVFILWKKLYSPQTGPINRALMPVLDQIQTALAALPAWGGWLLAAPVAVLLVFVVHVWSAGLARRWRDGEAGPWPVAGAVFLFCGLLLAAHRWLAPDLPVQVVGAACLMLAVVRVCWSRARYTPFSGTAHGTARRGDTMLFVSMLVAALCLLLLFLGQVLLNLPAKASAGLTPPEWLSDYHWAKPSLILMGLWAAIGSNNMILYLAGLSNISPELYEAAEVDGAGWWQKFLFITWPQLAPVTFFIVVMSFIYGLQGGFEMAKTMTNGGPAGATTTLSFFIYMEGFETGRLGYASAIAWVLFILVLSLTLFNWKFGNRYMAD
jgi:multiple sugar transport system permease protein